MSTKSQVCTAEQFEASEKDAQKNFTGNKGGGGAVKSKCVCEDKVPIRLKKVEFLDGTNSDMLKSDSVQYVNLPRDKKWIDGTHVKNIDRLGYKPRIYVEFEKPGIHRFKIKLKADGANQVYSNGEKRRNSRFNHQTLEKNYETDPNGMKIIEDMFISVGGGDLFHATCKDEHGTNAKSKVLKTKRLVYYREVKMTGTVGTNAASSLSAYRDEFKKHKVTLVKQSALTISPMENIGSNSESTLFIGKTRNAFDKSDSKKKLPYCALIAYSSHLAVKRSNQEIVKKNVVVGTGKGPVTITIAGPGLTNPKISTRALWNNIKTGEGWYVKAYYQQKGGVRGFFGVKNQIAESKITKIPASWNANYYSKVKVDVTGLPAGKGKIVLVVNWVDRMRGGLSFIGNNLICVCTKAWWNRIDTAAQNQVIIHEMGHKFNMTPDGVGTNVDKISSFYDSSKGHVGTHCFTGNSAGMARYDTDAVATNSTCVMYGSTNGKSAFCSNCKKAVKKQDMTHGWAKV